MKQHKLLTPRFLFKNLLWQKSCSTVNWYIKTLLPDSFKSLFLHLIEHDLFMYSSNYCFHVQWRNWGGALGTIMLPPDKKIAPFKYKKWLFFMFFLLQILPYCKKVTTYLICSLLQNYVTTCPFCLKYSKRIIQR